MPNSGTHTNSQWLHSYNGPMERKNRGVFIGLTVLQICLGIINIIFGLGLFIICSSHYRCRLLNWVCECDEWTNVSANLWGGLVVIVCSALSFCKVKSPTKVPKYTPIVMTFIGVGTCLTALGLEVAGAIKTQESRTSMILHILGAIFFLLTALVFFLGLSVKNNVLSDMRRRRDVETPAEQNASNESQEAT